MPTKPCGCRLPGFTSFVSHVSRRSRDGKAVWRRAQPSASAALLTGDFVRDIPHGGTRILSTRQTMQLDRIEGKPDEKVAWGSDVAAQMLRRLGIPYISLNPGASYRGLHDSIVNHLGNERPGILLCLHEDHSVAIAHGYAKATGEPMACVLHSNVGLLHGMMSLFNAWCDRVPMIVLGATGPLDAEKRRPWIDW